MRRTKNDAALRKVADVVALADRRDARPLPRLVLADGAVATIERGALELRDEGGRLLVRYIDGCAEIAAPSGDLVLSSPNGRVVLRSGVDVEIDATRDVVQRAGRDVTTVARSIASRAEHIALSAEKYELVASRLFEKTRDAFRDVTDLAQTRVGRARTIVSSLFTLQARRTVMTSKEETSIDGRKILLG